jgi:hypothetical protein
MTSNVNRVLRTVSRTGDQDFASPGCHDPGMDFHTGRFITLPVMGTNS